MMKRMMLCLAVVSIGLTANAQTNSNHLMFGVGALYEKGLDATIAYEHGSNGITITPGIWALSISHV